MTLCVAGGTEATIHSNAQNQLKIEAGGQEVTLERHEAQGLVAGLNNSMTAIEAQQANVVRACTEPYKGRIMELLLNPENKVPEAPSPTRAPPAGAPSLLSPAYRTNYMDEATDFGSIPTIGLNPNVNDFTPSYINGGAVITTGELRYAMQTGAPFALIDVLQAQHTPIPGAYLVPGAGMVDYTDEVAKQNWFISQLLRITRGSYDEPIVIYCLGVRCWESFNAATRAIIGGFRSVYWYRGGITSWYAAFNSTSPPTASQAGPRAVAAAPGLVPLCEEALRDDDLHEQRFVRARFPAANGVPECARPRPRIAKADAPARRECVARDS